MKTDVFLDAFFAANVFIACRKHKISLALLLYYGGRKKEALEVIANDNSQELEQFKDVLKFHIAYQGS